jgi:Fic family protein
LAATILAKRKAYYEALEAANKNNEITAWLSWFAAIALEAQRRTIARVEFLIDKTRLLDRLREHLNHRQEKVLLRMLQEGPEGFKGGLSAGNICHYRQSIARNDDTRSHRHGRQGCAYPCRRTPPCPLSFGDSAATGSRGGAW